MFLKISEKKIMVNYEIRLLEQLLLELEVDCSQYSSKEFKEFLYSNSKIFGTLILNDIYSDEDDKEPKEKMQDFLDHQFQDYLKSLKTFEIHIIQDKATCSSSISQSCPFLRSRNFGQEHICGYFDERVFYGENTYIQRCPSCVEKFGK